MRNHAGRQPPFGHRAFRYSIDDKLTVPVTDLPDKLKPRIVYVVGEDGYDWSAAMLCPGWCGKTLEMNLLPDAHPAWKITEQPNGLVTLHPSVWLKTGCACHFILSNGRVRWA